jgi:hypothetical protein
MPSEEFEPAIPAIKWMHNYAIDHMVTGTGNVEFYMAINS